MSTGDYFPHSTHPSFAKKSIIRTANRLCVCCRRRNNQSTSSKKTFFFFSTAGGNQHLLLLFERESARKNCFPYLGEEGIGMIFYPPMNQYRIFRTFLARNSVISQNLYLGNCSITSEDHISSSSSSYRNQHLPKTPSGNKAFLSLLHKHESNGFTTASDSTMHTLSSVTNLNPNALNLSFEQCMEKSGEINACQSRVKIECDFKLVSLLVFL